MPKSSSIQVSSLTVALAGLEMSHSISGFSSLIRHLTQEETMSTEGVMDKAEVGAPNQAFYEPSPDLQSHGKTPKYGTQSPNQIPLHIIKSNSRSLEFSKAKGDSGGPQTLPTKSPTDIHRRGPMSAAPTGRQVTKQYLRPMPWVPFLPR